MICTQSTCIRTLFGAYTNSLCEATEKDTELDAPEVDVKAIEAAVKAELKSPSYYLSVMPKKVLDFELPEAADKFTSWSDEIEIEPSECGPIGIIYTQIAFKYRCAWALVQNQVFVVLNLHYSWKHAGGGSNGYDIRMEITMSNEYDNLKIEVR